MTWDFFRWSIHLSVAIWILLIAAAVYLKRVPAADRRPSWMLDVGYIVHALIFYSFLNYIRLFGGYVGPTKALTLWSSLLSLHVVVSIVIKARSDARLAIPREDGGG